MTLIKEYHQRNADEAVHRNKIDNHKNPTNIQTEINSLKNPVDDFTSKWVDTYEVMQMLSVSRRTMNNYMKAVKLILTRVNKRNYFAINQVKGLMHIPEVPRVRCFQEDIQRMIQLVARMNEEEYE